jgi:hypothetical protein
VDGRGVTYKPLSLITGITLIPRLRAALAKQSGIPVQTLLKEQEARLPYTPALGITKGQLPQIVQGAPQKPRQRKSDFKSWQKLRQRNTDMQLVNGKNQHTDTDAQSVETPDPVKPPLPTKRRHALS